MVIMPVFVSIGSGYGSGRMITIYAPKDSGSSLVVNQTDDVGDNALQGGCDSLLSGTISVNPPKPQER